MAKRFTFYDDKKNSISHNITPVCLINVFKKSEVKILDNDIVFEILIKDIPYTCIVEKSSLKGDENTESLHLAVKKAAKWYKAMVLLEQNNE